MNSKSLILVYVEDDENSNLVMKMVVERVMKLHRDALILAEVLGPRVQTQYKQEYLATLLTADTIFGVAEAYDKGGIAMVMPG